MGHPILTMNISYEQDVVTVRQRVRKISESFGFDRQDQTRIATAVSEIARNAFEYAKEGKVECEVEGNSPPQLLLIRISDRGPGIPYLSEILDSTYRSRQGMGLGIVGARRLMDQCHVESVPGKGTTVTMKKLLPAKAPLVTPNRLEGLCDELAKQAARSPLEEIQQQNQELMRTLSELRERQDDLVRMNRELEDTNRGVVALYAELDEKADHLRRADDMKSRFLSNMSHEFRTPLSSIVALSQLLLERVDGELNLEQDKQVRFIRKGAGGLLELVNDLLDLAKIEAGKIDVKPVEFTVANLFSALRGMLRPLLVGDKVNLVIEDPPSLAPLYTDEAKVSQILRNFISNALKFTERGEVRVTAALAADGQSIQFAVADTGIGIAAEDLGVIFEEFTQVENPLQKQVKGTGLGLPLCRKLATLLRGTVGVTSEIGIGSTFVATIPTQYEPLPAMAGQVVLPSEDQQALLPILVVEDDEETLLLYDKYLRGSPFRVVPAATLREARRILEQVRPGAILLDILLRGEDTWSWLAALKADEQTKDIPIVVVTTVEDQRKGLALGAEAYCVKPVEQDALLSHLSQLTRVTAPPPVTSTPGLAQILIIDDDDASRYLLRHMLSGARCTMREANNATDGIRLAQETKPTLVFLDLVMPGMSGKDALVRLKEDPLTRDIPVVISTARALTDEDRRQLSRHARAVLAKEGLRAELLKPLLSEVGILV